MTITRGYKTDGRCLRIAILPSILLSNRVSLFLLLGVDTFLKPCLILVLPTRFSIFEVMATVPVTESGSPEGLCKPSNISGDETQDGGLEIKADPQPPSISPRNVHGAKASFSVWQQDVPV